MFEISKGKFLPAMLNILILDIPSKKQIYIKYYLELKKKKEQSYLQEP